MMATQDKRWDSSDSDDESVYMRGGGYLAPPRAAARVRTRSVLVVDDGVNGFDDGRAVPVAVMPPMPPTPNEFDGDRAMPAVMPPMPPMPDSPGRSPVEGVGLGLSRSKSRRKTLKEIIDGWWDLGLLEQKRQTMLAGRR